MKKNKKISIEKTAATREYRQKMNPEELAMFLHFKKRGAVVPSKKGKGSYDRKKLKRELCNAQKRRRHSSFSFHFKKS